ncbi:MAG: cadherin-like domain-containing protein, partial [Planctomycetaceae bacterium]
SITPVSGIDGGSSPGASAPGYGPVIYNFEPTGGMLSSNSVANGAWLEANVGAPGGGYVITTAMLSYTITRTDTLNNVSVIVPAVETVYTLTSQAPHGSVQRQVGSGWQAIATYDQFTQADINAGKIRFVHDGGEDHVASFGYQVSDGTANSYSSTFTIDVTPTNDQPGAGGGSAQVTEGNGNTVRLTTAAIGMSDADGSLDGKTGEGLADFLWFRVTGLAVDGAGTARGDLERWNGSAWVLVTTTEWLPSTLLS